MNTNLKEQSFPREEDDFENDGAYADDDVETETDGKTSNGPEQAQATMTAKQQPATKPGTIK